MNIGQLARRASVAVDTVRYYEKHGVLPPPMRNGSGYRCYGDEDIARLAFVRRAKALGFTLAEIRDLLTLSARRHDGMAGLNTVAKEKLADVEERLAELTRIRDGLGRLVEACPGHGTLDGRPILAALAPTD